MRAASASGGGWRSRAAASRAARALSVALEPASVGTAAEAAAQLAVPAERARHICSQHPVRLRAPAEPGRSAAIRGRADDNETKVATREEDAELQEGPAQLLWRE